MLHPGQIRELRMAVKEGIITKEDFISFVGKEPDEYLKDIRIKYREERLKLIKGFILGEFRDITPCAARDCYNEYIVMENEIPELFRTKPHQFGMIMKQFGKSTRVAYFDGKTRRIYA